MIEPAEAMVEPAAPTPPAEPASDGAAPAPGSLLADIRARREERLADERLDLPIPTWGGELVARYQVPDPSALARQTQARRAAGSDVEAASSANADFLIDCVAQVLARTENGRLEALMTPQGTAVRFDQPLADLLGVEVENAREVVAHLFASNPIAIGTQASTVLTWLQDTSQEVEGALVGESGAMST